jgi:hypothetical protein
MPAIPRQSNADLPVDDEGKYMRNPRLWLLIIMALSIPMLVLGVGVYSLMLPVDAMLHNRINEVIGADFQAFYIASLMVADGTLPEIYDMDAYSARSLLEIGSTAKYSWSYPPVAFFFIAPLAAFSFIPAMILWGLLQLAAAAWMLYRLYPPWLTTVITVFSPPLMLNFVIGQNGALSATILGGGLLLLSSYPVAAGLVFALAAYKPHLALLVPVCLLAGGHYRAFAAMAIGGISLVLASAAVFGIDTWLAFFEQMNNHLGYVDASRLQLDRFPTTYAAVLRLSGNVTVAQLAQGASSLAVVILVAWTWARTEAPAERALTLMAATLLATPYAYDYDLAILVVPFAWILKEYMVRKSPGFDLYALLAIWVAPPLAFILDAAIGWLLLLLMLVYGASRGGVIARTAIAR